MGIRPRFYWAMALVLFLLTATFQGAAFGKNVRKVVLISSHRDPLSPGVPAEVMIQVVDASGVPVPLYLSQVSATWDGETVTVIPMDEGWSPSLAALIPPSELTPQHLKRLRSQGFTFLTEESIQRAFSAPHTRFSVARKKSSPGRTMVAVLAATDSGTVSGELAMTVANQPISDPPVSGTLTVSAPVVEEGGIQTITATVLAPDIREAVMGAGLAPPSLTLEVAGCSPPLGPPLLGIPPLSLPSCGVSLFGHGEGVGGLGSGSVGVMPIDPLGTLPAGMTLVMRVNIPSLPFFPFFAHAFLFLRHANGASEVIFVSYEVKRTGQGIKVDLTPLRMELRPLGSGGTNKAELAVTVTDASGRPVSRITNLEFVVQVKPDTTINLTNEGGHQHVENRPLGSFEILTSSLGNVARKVEAVGNPEFRFQEATSSNGELFMRYTAPEFGGMLLLTATPIGQSLDPNSQNHAALNIQVQGLVSLESVVAALGTPVPIDFVGRTDTHPANHFFQPGAAADLINAALELVASGRTRLGVPIRVNDGSLLLGGGFDISARWRFDVDTPNCMKRKVDGQLAGHCLHRDGTSVDIEHLGKLTEVPIVNMKSLIKIMREHNWEFHDELQLAQPEEFGAIFPHFQWRKRK